MPHYVVTLVAEALNTLRLPLNGSRVLLAGVSYKRNVDDIRESPSLDLLALLGARGATVAYSDPHVPVLSGRLWQSGVDLEHVDLARVAPGAYDCIVVVTDHSAFNYDDLQRGKGRRRHAQCDRIARAERDPPRSAEARTPWRKRIAAPASTEEKCQAGRVARPWLRLPTGARRGQSSCYSRRVNRGVPDVHLSMASCLPQGEDASCTPRKSPKIARWRRQTVAWSLRSRWKCMLRRNRARSARPCTSEPAALPRRIGALGTASSVLRSVHRSCDW